MKVLIVDCYDSFTYNLYQLIGSLNAVPHVIKSDEDISEAPRDIDRLLLSPGPGKPRDQENCMKIIDHYETPTLGVCLGHQVIAQKYGGEIKKTTPIHGKTSKIIHSNTELFNGIPNSFKATRYHSLKLYEPVPKELEVTARAKEDDSIMAISHKKKPYHGIQFHPESIASEFGEKIIKNFIYGGTSQ